MVRESLKEGMSVLIPDNDVTVGVTRDEITRGCREEDHAKVFLFGY